MKIGPKFHKDLPQFHIYGQDSKYFSVESIQLCIKVCCWLLVKPREANLLIFWGKSFLFELALQCISSWGRLEKYFSWSHFDRVVLKVRFSTKLKIKWKKWLIGVDMQLNKSYHCDTNLLSRKYMFWSPKTFSKTIDERQTGWNR